MEPHSITIVYGDGVGPEIMEATMLILRESRAPLSVSSAEMGGQVYKIGNALG